MASIHLIGNTYRAQIRRSGQPVQTKSFAIKKYSSAAEAEQDAKDWVTLQEAAFLEGKQLGVRGKTGVTMGKAIDRYLEENKDISKTASDVYGYLKKGLGSILVDKITKADIIKYIQGKKFSAASGALHFSHIRTVLVMAKIVWEYHVPDILAETAKSLLMKNLIGESSKRTRRPTKDEITLLLNHKYPTEIPMADIIQFAISTAMRQSEITRIKHSTLNDDGKTKTVFITDRKHPTKKDNHQNVPLLPTSLEIIQRQKKLDGDDRIFPFRAQTIGFYFTQACDKLGIDDLHFHDLRHEGASRLFEMGYAIHEVAMFTGHDNWKTLQRYTHLNPQDLRSLEPEKKSVQIEELTMIEISHPRTKESGIVVDEKEMKEFEEFKRFKKMQEMMKAMEAA